MRNQPPRAIATLFGRPWHAVLAPIPFACFLIAPFTDIAYANTAEMQWSNMSAWLIAIGLIVSIPVVIFGLIDLLADRSVRSLGSAWIHTIGMLIAIVISIFNIFIHSRDAYTSVVPIGLTLSIVAAIVLVISTWPGWTMVYRQRVGVATPEDRR